jgi:hypothetical protein
MAEENIVKQTCKELGITYKQLGEAIGYSEDAIKKVAQTGELSKPMQKAIELLTKNIRLEKQANEISQLKELLRKFIN